MRRHDSEITVAGLRELAAEVFETTPEEITPDAGFYDDLGIDSLQKIEFVVQIERRSGIRLTDAEAARLDTFDDVLVVLRGRGLSLAD